jgi:hypothetical protein
MSLALVLLLSACGGGSGSTIAGDGGGSSGSGGSDGGGGGAVPGSTTDGGGSNVDPPVPVPPVVASNTVVAYSSETAELRIYAGQSQQLTLSFKTSDGGSASSLALALPSGGLPEAWRISSNRRDCAVVDAGNTCQVALTYAPTAAEQSSVLTVPYSYRNNKGEAGAGSIAIAYRALPVNAATATLLPGGPVRGVVGKAGNVTLSFSTNDGSPASDLHVDTALSSLPAGWTSASTTLDCANFGAGSPCQLALSYAPAAAAPAAVLAIGYRYKDSSGKQQAATASIDYSALAPNTVNVSANPAGVVRARAGGSQQVTLTFVPSDSSPASGLRLLTEAGKLPAGWTVKASALPCATVAGSGACSLTLVYAPGPDQPAGKLDLDYAYIDAVGRELTGKTSVSYKSHDYQAYVADFGGVQNNALTGGVRQCELDGDGKLSACVKAATTWPVFGANNVVVYGSHAYIGAYSFAEGGVPARQVSICKLAEDNALVDCAGSGPQFDQLSSLHVSLLGAFLVSGRGNGPELSYCPLADDGGLDANFCGTFPNTVFKDVPDGAPTAMTSTDSRVYLSVTNGSADQNLYSCALIKNAFLDCGSFAMGPTEQVVQRMSSGQAGGNNYLYLATSSRTDPMKAPGTIVKCALDDGGLVSRCDKGLVPPGMNGASLTRISDIRIVLNSAYLVTGDTDFTKKIYTCQVAQKPGDLAACASAGEVEGLRNFSIAGR